jgi:hypothetical protein
METSLFQDRHRDHDARGDLRRRLYHQREDRVRYLKY